MFTKVLPKVRNNIGTTAGLIPVDIINSREKYEPGPGFESRTSRFKSLSRFEFFT